MDINQDYILIYDLLRQICLSSVITLNSAINISEYPELSFSYKIETNSFVKFEFVLTPACLRFLRLYPAQLKQHPYRYIYLIPKPPT